MKIYDGKLGTSYGPFSARRAYRALSHCRVRGFNFSQDTLRYYIGLYIHIQDQYPKERLFLRWKHSGDVNKDSLIIYPESILRGSAFAAASNSWSKQVERCTKKSHKQFKYYGAKGIEVKYSLHEFIEWWLKELKSFNGSIPTVGRINHDGHYEFSNIKLEDKSKNSKERIYRIGGIKKTQPIAAFSDEQSHAFSSCSEAAKFFGVRVNRISRLASSKAAAFGYKFERIL